jgi:hypothetical protein
MDVILLFCLKSKFKCFYYVIINLTNNIIGSWEQQQIKTKFYLQKTELREKQWRMWQGKQTSSNQLAFFFFILMLETI